MAQSRVALPVTAVYALLVWVGGGLVSRALLPQLVCSALATYFMVELNNRNALIRIYSRMVSCAFLVLTVTANFMFPSLQAYIVQLCFVAFYAFLFPCYQRKQSQGVAFYAFFCLGLASTVYVHILFFVPLFWIFTATYIQSLTLRTWMASLFGLVLPYWFVAGYLVYTGQLGSLPAHFQALATFGPVADFSGIALPRLLTLGFITLLALVGAVHFFRHSYNDKIRTRMLFSIFTWTAAATLAFIVAQPQHIDTLLGLMIVNTAPLIGHYIALTHTRWTNISVILMMCAAILLTALNLWTQ